MLLCSDAAAAAAAWLVQLQMLLSLVGASVLLDSFWVGFLDLFGSLWELLGASGSFGELLIASASLGSPWLPGY